MRQNITIWFLKIQLQLQNTRRHSHVHSHCNICNAHTKTAAVNDVICLQMSKSRSNHALLCTIIYSPTHSSDLAGRAVIRSKHTSPAGWVYLTLDVSSHYRGHYLLVKVWDWCVGSSASLTSCWTLTHSWKTRSSFVTQFTDSKRSSPPIAASQKQRPPYYPAQRIWLRLGRHTHAHACTHSELYLI